MRPARLLPARSRIHLAQRRVGSIPRGLPTAAAFTGAVGKLMIGTFVGATAVLPSLHHPRAPLSVRPPRASGTVDWARRDDGGRTTAAPPRTAATTGAGARLVSVTRAGGPAGSSSSAPATAPAATGSRNGGGPVSELAGPGPWTDVDRPTAPATRGERDHDLDATGFRRLRRSWSTDGWDAGDSDRHEGGEDRRHSDEHQDTERHDDDGDEPERED